MTFVDCVGHTSVSALYGLLSELSDPGTPESLDEQTEEKCRE